MDLVARRCAGLAVAAGFEPAEESPPHASEVWGLLFVDVLERHSRSGSNHIAPMRTPAYDHE
jgi:hypothetical protein